MPNLRNSFDEDPNVVICGACKCPRTVHRSARTGKLTLHYTPNHLPTTQIPDDNRVVIQGRRWSNVLDLGRLSSVERLTPVGGWEVFISHCCADCHVASSREESIQSCTIGHYRSMDWAKLTCSDPAACLSLCG